MKYVLIAGILIIIAFIVALQFIPIGIEPLTEVYLENHTTLPVGGLVNKTYNYTFTVHNLEYREMSYSYEVLVEYDNESLNLEDKILGRGDFSLADNESITIKEFYYFDKSFDRAKIKTIVYKDNNESIDVHFWINEVRPFEITIIEDEEIINDTNGSGSSI
jgi:hypothetical protein